MTGELDAGLTVDMERISGRHAVCFVHRGHDGMDGRYVGHTDTFYAQDLHVVARRQVHYRTGCPIQFSASGGKSHR